MQYTTAFVNANTTVVDVEIDDNRVIRYHGLPGPLAVSDYAVQSLIRCELDNATADYRIAIHLLEERPIRSLSEKEAMMVAKEVCEHTTVDPKNADLLEKAASGKNPKFILEHVLWDLRGAEAEQVITAAMAKLGRWFHVTKREVL